MDQSLLPHLLGQQLTEEMILPLLNDPIGIYGYKDTHGNILDISPNSIHLFPSRHFKHKKDIQNRAEHDLFQNPKLVDLYHSHDKFTHAGQSWAGIEPVHWKDEYVLFFSQKFPVYNQNNNIVGSFYLGHLINNTELTHLIEDLNQVQQNIYPDTPLCFNVSPQNEAISLTQREMECLFYSLRGNTAKNIGRLLNISQKTVETHIEHIKHKFKCYSKSELIAKAIELGYLEKIPQPILQKLLA